MYKHLLSLSVALLSCHAVAENVTNIKAAEVTGPVHVGIFRGFCNKLDLTKLQKPSDFASMGTSTCAYMTDETLDPKKPKSSVKAWHQGAGSLVLVAFQSGGTPVQCTIGDYKTMFVLGGAGGLKCTSPEEVGSEEEAEAPPPAAPAPIKAPPVAEAPSAVEDAPDGDDSLE